ncbi:MULTISPECIES: hypothetical protein [unclassified Phaeobacter]|uniref:hypothetical protein n=1 Tax=unclassified Phaeobacter TaxID=2621772 RepID=UPI003A846466
MTDPSKEAVERYQPYGGAGKLPTECCEYSVVDNEAGKEICRVWDVEDARKIAFVLNRCLERDRVVSKLRAQLQAAREVIGRAGRHADVICGAVESNQVVDKDVHGVAKMIRDYCRAALKSTSTEGEG